MFVGALWEEHLLASADLVEENLLLPVRLSELSLSALVPLQVEGLFSGVLL